MVDNDLTTPVWRFTKRFTLSAKLSPFTRAVITPIQYHHTPTVFTHLFYRLWNILNTFVVAIPPCSDTRFKNVTIQLWNITTLLRSLHLITTTALINTANAVLCTDIHHVAYDRLRFLSAALNDPIYESSPPYLNLDVVLLYHLKTILLRSRNICTILI